MSESKLLAHELVIVLVTILDFLLASKLSPMLLTMAAKRSVRHG